jgi:hypothetical protein
VTGQTRVNGTTALSVPILGAVTPIHVGGLTAEHEAPAPAAEPAAEPRPDLVAEAEAARIRALTYAETEAARIAAEAQAEAIRIKAEAEAEKQRLANERTAMRMEKERADHELRLAETNRKREESDRQRQAAQAAEQATRDAEAELAKEIATADDKWRAYAIRFAFVCGIVSLPVQMSFFWNPKAPWMAAAPIMLEGAAWVVHRGARAAVANRRPVWHYRLIVWLLAFAAAGINLYHGLHSFDPGTALATAFASVAGPGVWDLHEHGRIRKRDGKLTRRERKAQERAEKRAAAEQAAREAGVRAEKEAAEQAAKTAAEELAKTRAEDYENEWKHAKKLAAALGETTVTESVWKRAWHDIHGTDPGDTVDTIRTRRTAERRIEMARGETPSTGGRRTALSQRPAQMPPTASRGSTTLRNKPVPPRRRKGDTAPYHPVAKAAAAETARRTAVTATVSDTSRKDA